MDIDHFKRVNDTFGHAAGDVVLRHVADVLSASVRTEDIVGRWGGEEFVAVLPHTDLEGARLVAARAKVAVHDSLVAVGTGGDEVGVTVSIGCTSSLDESVEAVFARADAALYRAKEAGRNRIECFPPPARRPDP